MRWRKRFLPLNGQSLRAARRVRRAGEEEANAMMGLYTSPLCTSTRSGIAHFAILLKTDDRVQFSM